MVTPFFMARMLRCRPFPYSRVYFHCSKIRRVSTHANHPSTGHNYIIVMITITGRVQHTPPRRRIWGIGNDKIALFLHHFLIRPSIQAVEGDCIISYILFCTRPPCLAIPSKSKVLSLTGQ